MSPRPRARDGRFIALEGLDGAGTTTQAQRLAEALRGQGFRVHTTREPSEGPIGAQLRQALIRRLTLAGGQPLSDATLALLFAADRRDHIDAEVAPALERGEWVISDRYVLSSLAYQGETLPMKWVEAINQTVPSPDLTIFLEVDARTAGERRRGRGGARELFEEDARQERVARAYRAAIRLRRRKERIVSLDGRAPVEAVTRAALAALRRLR